MALTAYSSPLPSLFCVVCGNRVGLALTNVVVTTLFFAGMSSLTVTSRIGFALARDGAFPASGYLRRVSPTTKSPIPMVILVLIIDCMLLLLPLATMQLDSEYGAIAFNAVTSICVIGYQISYCIPLMLRGTVMARTFVQSTFSLGRAGAVVANIAWIWLFITSLFLFWPSTFPVNQYNMNYTVVVVAGFFLIALLWWTVGGARHFFKGPLRVDAKVFKQIARESAAAAAEGSKYQTVM
jgi:amino acid transporter